MTVRFNTSMNRTDGVTSLPYDRYELVESPRQDFG